MLLDPAPDRGGGVPRRRHARARPVRWGWSTPRARRSATCARSRLRPRCRPSRSRAGSRTTRASPRSRPGRPWPPSRRTPSCSAAELVGAVARGPAARAGRARRPGWGAVVRAVRRPAIRQPAGRTLADRDLTPDIAAAADVLPALARTWSVPARPQGRARQPDNSKGAAPLRSGGGQGALSRDDVAGRVHRRAGRRHELARWADRRPEPDGRRAAAPDRRPADRWQHLPPGIEQPPAGRTAGRWTGPMFVLTHDDHAAAGPRLHVPERGPPGRRGDRRRGRG